MTIPVRPNYPGAIYDVGGGLPCKFSTMLIKRRLIFHIGYMHGLPIAFLLGMQKIPFTIRESGKLIKGSLDVVYGAGSSCEIPTNFHVMVERYYRGCLFMRRDQWVLPDSKLEQFAGYLGNVVEAWFE